jgi:hypothetical protein
MYPHNVKVQLKFRREEKQIKELRNRNWKISLDVEFFHA